MEFRKKLQYSAIPMVTCLIVFIIIKYRFIYVNSNYDICICKEEDGMVHTIRVLKGHSHPVLQLLYNEELYHLFSCGSDGLFFWDLNRDSEPVQMYSYYCLAN